MAMATCARPCSSCCEFLLSCIDLLFMKAGGQGLGPSSLLHSPAKLGLILEWSWDVKTHNKHRATGKHTARGHLPASGKSSSAPPFLEMLIYSVVRNQEPQVLSSHLCSCPSSFLTPSFLTFNLFYCKCSQRGPAGTMFSPSSEPHSALRPH